jgi:hypothetical protein
MRHWLRLFIWCLLGVCIHLALTGCEGDVSGPALRDEIAVFGFLFVGETVNDSNAVLITRTQPLLDRYDLEQAAVTSATVTLCREGDSHADTLSMVRPGYYANPSIVIDSLTTYHLTVSVPGEDVITATTATPVSYDLSNGPRPLPNMMRHVDIPDSFPFVLTCPDEEQIFMLDVYCLESWEDARYINPFGDHDRPDDEEEYGYETGEPRHIFAYFRIKDVAREGDTYTIGFYSAMMAFWGSYEVSLLAIDDNYYNYLYREHPEESGGIIGGIGVFGSACRRRYLVEITQ